MLPDVLLSDLKYNDRDLPRICCNLLGLLVRRRALTIRQTLKTIRISVVGAHRAAITWGWRHADMPW